MMQITCFLLAMFPQHKPVSSRTLARWVSGFLQKASFHAKTFITHSLHSASTPNFFSSGLSLTEIAKETSWMDKYGVSLKLLFLERFPHPVNIHVPSMPKPVRHTDWINIHLSRRICERSVDLRWIVIRLREPLKKK